LRRWRRFSSLGYVKPLSSYISYISDMCIGVAEISELAEAWGP
jgi:hypothetical protein